MQRELTIVNRLGLHARAAAKFAALATKFNCEIEVTLADRQANGKSIMSLMMLAAGKGKTIVVHATGEDATEAIQQLQTLVENRFDEME
ncbi:MAG TPA: HPr family phosphocarrier protein [Gammaproteobacteria bacterium]|nr:HPr family phosphocarrier protein [Gammaproteobacteria bacterium]